MTDGPKRDLVVAHYHEVGLKGRNRSFFERRLVVAVNQPGVLKQVNEVLSPYNVEKQYSDSKGEVAYLMADIADVSPQDVNRLREMIIKTSANILTRLLA